MFNTHKYVFLSTISSSKIISEKGHWRVVKNVLDLLNVYSFFGASGAMGNSRDCVPVRWRKDSETMAQGRTKCGGRRDCRTPFGSLSFERRGQRAFFIACM